MPEAHHDPLTELIRILREQIARQEERIAALEVHLEQAKKRIEEQERLLQQRAQEIVELREQQEAAAALLSPVATAFPEPATPLVASAPAAVLEAAETEPERGDTQPLPPLSWRDPEAGTTSEKGETQPLEKGETQPLPPLPSRESAAEMPPDESDTQPLSPGERQPARIRLPNLGPPLHEIAQTVLAAARTRTKETAPEVEEGEVDEDVTARYDRSQLRQGHEALARKRRRHLSAARVGLWVALLAIVVLVGASVLTPIIYSARKANGNAARPAPSPSSVRTP